MIEEITGEVEQCPWCGASEIESESPRTTYSCGSSCYDQCEGTWQQSALCRQRAESWRETVLKTLSQDEILELEIGIFIKHCCNKYGKEKVREKLSNQKKMENIWGIIEVLELTK